MSQVEVDGDRREPSKPGLYVHKESGAELEAVTPIQGDAFRNLGYEYQGEAKPAKETKEAK